MRRHTRSTRPVGRVAGGALVLALALGGLAGCAKSEDTEDVFDTWLADHPVPGATLESRRATDSLMGEGELFATYTLTASPSQSTIRRAMRGACRFDAVTEADASYTLEVGDRTLDVACRPANQRKVAGFWSETKDLDVQTLALGEDSVVVTVTEPNAAVSRGLLDDLSQASRASGLRLDNGFRVNGPGAAYTVTRSPDGSPTELAAIRRLAGVAGSSLVQVNAIPGQVIAATRGTVQQARQWEDTANGDGRRVLVVGSTRTSWLQLPTEAERDLVDKVAVRPAVRRVSVGDDEWTVDVVSTAAARTLVRDLGADEDAPAVADLGDLQAEIEAPTSSGTATARTRCSVDLDLPRADVGLTLLGLCAVPGVEVRPSPQPDGSEPQHQVRTSPDQLPAVMKVLRALPDRTRLELSKDAPPYSTAQLRTGDRLSASGEDRAWVQAVGRAWQQAG